MTHVYAPTKPDDCVGKIATFYFTDQTIDPIVGRIQHIPGPKHGNCWIVQPTRGQLRPGGVIYIQSFNYFHCQDQT